VGYTAFMANEVRTNREKYSDANGKISSKKVKAGFINAVKAFLSFDLSYVGLKTLGQSALLAAGQDPAVASALFDGLAIPSWYSIAVPLGLEKGVIETKSYPKTKSGETKDDRK
jgi:hypothetical protein